MESDLIICLIIIPLIANVFFFFKYIKYSTITASVFDIFISLYLLLFHVTVSNSLFFINDITIYFIIMVSSIYLLSSLFSINYLKGIKTKISEREYFLLLNFFTSSMFFALSINNIGLMWVGIEATTISTILLVVTEGTEASLEAGWRYTILVSAGVTFAFISVILIYYSFHTLSISTLLEERNSSLILKLASAIALVGFGTKVGVFPVNTWLPDAHSEAPAPISAMFSGVLLPVALYVLYIIYLISPLPILYSWFAIISIIVASIMMASQTNFKRLFAYSTIENMNLALLGFTYGSLTGAIILLISHAFGKAGAFYSSGSIFKMVGDKKIDEYGLWRLKFIPHSLLLSSLAVTGTPPFGTFIGEFLILSRILAFSTLQFILLIIFLAIVFISINFHISKMIFKGQRNLSEDKVMGIISLVSSVISLGIGIYILWWVI
ncbi:proton-conducting transporter membrane subunit [Acidianus manzaensis]|uniref:proton-conducting transporter transmembrane domain-containing protein n=1 Tax=Acidianus manzaensis TaxID=282676 RepID=UPI00164FD2A8|nr:proton-conducting transporter membrane subunit [Acidianus manzaensis]